MARQIGIRQNTIQVVISGARVAFDPRGTAEAHDTRDPKNYKADEKPLRELAWRLRQKHSHNEAA